MVEHLKITDSLKLLKDEIELSMSCDHAGADLVLAILKNSKELGEKFNSIKNHLKKTLFKLLKYAKQEKFDDRETIEFVATKTINTIYPECLFGDISFGEALIELANIITCLFNRALPYWDDYNCRSILSNDDKFAIIVAKFDLNVARYHLTISFI